MRPIAIVGLGVLLVLLCLPASAVRAQGSEKGQDVEQMIMHAKTAADHEAIAAYYDHEAAEAKAKAAFHKRLADTYREFHMKPGDMAHHCDQIARYFGRIAQDDAALAEEHRAMAKAVK